MGAFYLAHIEKRRCLSWSVDLPPCQEACPLGIDVEGYITAISRGDFPRALEIIREKCPLPSVCGRVCHHPCETACKRREFDDPIAIRALKQFLADHEHSDQQRPQPVDELRSERIAIIGSGPAGLTAAHDLAIQGYPVTIYEALEIPGGMLANGIPEFDLPQEIVQGEIDYIKALGVEIRTNTHIGQGLSLDEIKEQGFKAVLIAIGAQGSGELHIPGMDLEGVWYALPFLKGVKLGGKYKLEGKVAVIGGGNVAIDAARTALRLGSDEVHVLCVESRDAMSAFDWVVHLAEAEGIRIHPSVAVQELCSENGKKVSHIGLTRVSSFMRDKEGRISFEVDENPHARSTMEVNGVIIAVGQTIDLRGMDQGFTLSPKGTLIIDPNTGATNVEGVFAAGDIVDMPSTVVESMASGRRAAASIARYLKGEDLKVSADTRQLNTGTDVLPDGIATAARQDTQLLSADKRIHSFEEVEMGFSKEQAMQEAARCLRCKTCNRCIEETECIALSLVANNDKTSPRIGSLLCASCGRCARACPYSTIELAELE